MPTTVPHDPMARELFDEMARWPIFDPHSHIDPHRPAARNLDEVLGYHYYTELAHSAGMPADRVAAELAPAGRAPQPGRIPRPDRQHRPVFLAAGDRPDVPRLRRTTGSPPRRSSELLRRAPTTRGDGAAWDREVWDQTRLEAVFLTNDFDDPLEGWDTAKYVPCLRTDDLVLKLHEPRPSSGCRRSTDVDVQDLRHACARRSASCSSSSSSAGRGPARSACRPTSCRSRPARSGRRRRSAGPCTGWTSGPTSTTRSAALVFWTLAEFCAEFRLPFDLMIGPIRNVYPAGVAGGRDLFDRRVSLYDYRELFNTSRA